MTWCLLLACKCRRETSVWYPFANSFWNLASPLRSEGQKASAVCGRDALDRAFNSSFNCCLRPSFRPARLRLPAPGEYGFCAPQNIKCTRDLWNFLKANSWEEYGSEVWSGRCVEMIPLWEWECRVHKTSLRVTGAWKLTRCRCANSQWPRSTLRANNFWLVLLWSCDSWRNTLKLKCKSNLYNEEEWFSLSRHQKPSYVWLINIIINPSLPFF